MKNRIHRYDRAALVGALVSTALLTACGGGGNDAPAVSQSAQANLGATATGTAETAQVQPAQISVSGRVMNVGYLGNTQVCYDINDDGACGTDEPTGTTDAQGRYTLTVPSGHRGANLLALVRPTSVDSAATEADPVPFGTGWTLAAMLEYGDGATQAIANISPLTATYYARTRLSGRNRLNNQIAVFTRIVFEPNVDPITGQLIRPVDFDYVAADNAAVRARVKALGSVLTTRSNNAGQPLNALNTSAVMAAWYNTYTAPTASAAGVPVDASKIASLTGNNTVEAYLANDYHYYGLKADAALRLRDGLAETAGASRVTGSGTITDFLRRSYTLSNGTLVQKLAKLANDVWTALTSDEGSYFTFTPQGTLVVNAGTDYLQQRAIAHLDGNRVTFRMPGNQARLAFDVADGRGANYQIEEWVGQQRSYANYYNGTVPATAPVASAPEVCNKQYPNSPQTGRNVSSSTGLATGTTAQAWFETCFDYYTAEYYDLKVGDLQLKSSEPGVVGSEFYDGTLYDAMVVIPAKQSCDTGSTSLSRVSTLGQSHCGWAVDAQAGHALSDLFASGGVALNSWAKTYGTTTFTSGSVSTVKTAGSEAQSGLPQQLRLTLNRSGNETSGTGTLYSEYGAWTSTSNTAVTETINWEISPSNPNMVLISWPFRDANDPRVKSTQASNGSTAVTAPVLTAHFAADFNGNTFSLTPPTHTSVNLRKMAIVLQDGVFIVGQYYPPGYTYSERYLLSSAMDKGLAALRYVYGKLFDVGFKDQ